MRELSQSQQFYMIRDASLSKEKHINEITTISAGEKGRHRKDRGKENKSVVGSTSAAVSQHRGM